MSLTVVLDPGHGGSDPGAVDPPNLAEGDYILTREATRALELAGAVGYVLKQATDEIRVVMTRTDDRYVGLDERARIANAARADRFVSVHLNAATPQAKGMEVWYGTAAGGQTLAQLIHDSLVRANATTRLFLADRGVKDGSWIRVLNQTRMPACLVELNFITNPTEELLSDDHTERLAFGRAVAAGILRSLGLDASLAWEIGA